MITTVDAKGKILSREKTHAQKREKKNTEEKAKEGKIEEKKKGFISRFAGKRVELRLISGEVFTGKLLSDAYNKFDMLIINSEGTFLIPKHAVAYIHLGDKNPKII